MARQSSLPDPAPDADAGRQAFTLMFRNHPLAAYVYDLTTLALLDANGAAEEFFGCTHDALCALTLNDLCPEGERGTWSRHAAAVQAAGNDAADQLLLAGGGRRLDVRISSHAIDFEGRAAAVGVIQDCCARTAAEARLASFPLSFNRASMRSRMSRSMRSTGTTGTSIAMLPT